MRDAGVVRDRRTDPASFGSHQMSWLSPPQLTLRNVCAAVDRLEERAVRDENLVLVRRRDGEMDVVARRGRSARATSSPRASCRRRRRSARPIPDPWSESARRRGSNRSARPRRRSCRAAIAADPPLRPSSISCRRRATRRRRCPAPPLIIAHGCISTCQVPANSVRGFFASIDRPEQPVFSSTNSTRSQCWPPSVVRNTPRSCCGAGDPSDRAGEDDVGIGRDERGCGRCGRFRRGPCASRSCPASIDL